MDTVEDIEMIPSVGTKLHLVFCSETNMGFVNPSIHLPYEMILNSCGLIGPYLPPLQISHRELTFLAPHMQPGLGSVLMQRC